MANRRSITWLAYSLLIVVMWSPASAQTNPTPSQPPSTPPSAAAPAATHTPAPPSALSTPPIQPQKVELHTYFAEHLRGNLFSGFLTLGGFLLSLQMFIVVKIKEDLYDSDAFCKHVKAMREIKPDLEHYGPLRRFSHFLTVAVSACLVTAVAQLSVGLVEKNWASWICIGLAVASSIWFIVVLVAVFLNLKTWFGHLETTSPVTPQQSQPEVEQPRDA